MIRQLPALLVIAAAITLLSLVFWGRATPAMLIGDDAVAMIRGGAACYTTQPITCIDQGNVNGGCGGVTCAMVPIDDGQYSAPQCLDGWVYTFDGAPQNTTGAENTGDDGPDGAGTTGTQPPQPYWCGNWYTCDTTSPTYTSTACTPSGDGSGNYVCAAVSGPTANNASASQLDPNSASCPWHDWARSRPRDDAVVAIARANGLLFQFQRSLGTD